MSQHCRRRSVTHIELKCLNYFSQRGPGGSAHVSSRTGVCGTRAYAGLRNCPTIYLAGATASEKVELCQQRTLLMAFCTVVLLPFALYNVTEKKKRSTLGLILFSTLSFILILFRWLLLYLTALNYCYQLILRG